MLHLDKVTSSVEKHKACSSAWKKNSSHIPSVLAFLPCDCRKRFSLAQSAGFFIQTFTLKVQGTRYYECNLMLKLTRDVFVLNDWHKTKGRSSYKSSLDFVIANHFTLLLALTKVSRAFLTSACFRFHIHN